MSSAEPTLGADLYVKAVEAGLPKLVKEGGAKSSAEDFAALGMSIKDMARFLVKKDLVTKDEDGVWARNDEKIRGLGESEEQEFLPLYEAAVREHETAVPALIAEGKSDYVDYVRDMHIPQDFEVEAQTVSRVREEDMQAIVSSSLNLLDAVHKDPANAAFVKGLDNASTNALWSVLEQSSYLMPGENPDRKAPLGEQALRGTPEEREAVLFQASALAANLELPESITAGDRPTAYAAMLRNAVQGAKTEEVVVDGLNATPDMHFDSDLTREDANSLFNFLGATNRMMQNAQFDPNNIEALVVPSHLAEATKFWLDDAKEKGVHHALGSGNFEAPGIDSKFALRLADAMKWTEEALTTDVELTNYTGDDGGSLTQEGAMQDENWGLDNAFDRDADETSESAAVKEEYVEDSSADKYVGKVRTVALNESMCQIIDQVSAEALEGGAMEKLRMHAGRAASETADLEGGRAAFGTFEEAMGADRVATTPEVSNRLSEVMSIAAWRNMNPSRREKLRVAQVEEGRGPFKGYKSGAPDIAGKRITRFIDENMLIEDPATGENKPNLDMRRFLRDASQMPVVGSSKQEAQAVRDYAVKFVARDEEEHRRRREKAFDKEDLVNIEFTSEEAQRMIRVAEASGNEAPARLAMSKDGFATLSHPDAPALKAPMDKVLPEIENSDKSPRKFSGNLSVEQLKAAVQTGAEKIVVQVHGENPIGVIGKLQEAEAPSKERPKRRHEALVLS